MATKKPVKKPAQSAQAKAKPTAKAIAESAVKETKPVAAEPTKTETKINIPEPVKKWGKRIAQFVAHSSLPEIFLVASLCLSRYLQNSDFSYPSEIILSIVMFAILSTVVTYVFKLILRGWRGTHLASLLLVYDLYAFTYAYPRLNHWASQLTPHNATAFASAMLHVLYFAIVFGLLGFLLNLLTIHIKQIKAIPLVRIGVFAICFIFVAQLYKVGTRLWTIRHDLAYKQPAISLQQDKSKITSKPNVYYLLFDRYASADTLQNDYNYDNSGLMNFLGGQGFVNRDSAYANYPFTMQSISSTLSLNYHTELNAKFQNDAKGFQTAFPYRTILSNPPIAQALQANGYNYNQVSSWWDFTRNVSSANDEPSESFRLRVFGKNFWLTDLQRDIVNKSIFSPLLLKGLTIHRSAVVKYELDRNPRENFEAEMSAVKNIASNSAKQTQPQFTFAHVLSPHDPYIFDASGNNPTYDGNRTDNGVDETVKYTNQVTYLNTRIEDLVSAIRKQDPKAVIVLQADEGPYPKQFRGTLTPGHYYDPINLPLTQMQQKFGVLASYYLPGTDSSTLSTAIPASVDAFRAVLNTYLGYNLSTLPDCQFTAGDKYALYNYQLVTGKLKSTAEPTVCDQYK